ncbi:MAG: 3-deoxy-8-phosphooctulonate synthase [Candidatus Nitronauta litoralis]|uniref:2-dehydro-3-deoxyphosphooctonate aldolase n=1 Tax=Candidatus Nitronauta litoralis TaxID=2705533 RepID=A0A7T0BTF0_9BACT|nr:MAG: 3-deoxy-8-phosphooctulonate synthase [Candidatus Nitronauta litoralis]
MTREIKVGNVSMGAEKPLAVIAGPCVIESRQHAIDCAGRLKTIFDEAGIPFIFKASYDKANRTSIESFRGPGIEAGLGILAEVKKEIDVPVLSDVHAVEEVDPASQVLDILQIPAFLCRQTDLVIKAAETGKPVNIKKGQFLAPWDMKHVVDKFKTTGNENVSLTERGFMFGYNNLVVDMRSLVVMHEFGCPVVFDCTHSLQLPGGQGTTSGGQRELVAPLTRAAVAVGVDALFMEVHPDPDNAPSDGPNMIKMETLPDLLEQIKELDLLRPGR